MLTTLHTTLARLLIDLGNIDADEVAVRFERPSRQWVDSLTMPTINLFLFGLGENTERRAGGGPQVSRSGNQAHFRVPPRRFDLRYLVSAFSSDERDEHMLLWRTLATLLRHSPLPPERLPAELAALDVPLATVIGGADEASQTMELWRAMELPPRPALIYTVTAPLDLELEFSAPLVLTRNLRTTDLRNGASEAAPLRIGGYVRSTAGEALSDIQIRVENSAANAETDGAGRYTLRLPREGRYTLILSRPGGNTRTATLDIPSDMYDIVIDQP